MRAGTIFLEFALSDTSAQQSGYGQRKYDWGRKQVCWDVAALASPTPKQVVDSKNKSIALVTSLLPTKVQFLMVTRLCVSCDADICAQPHRDGPADRAKHLLAHPRPNEGAGVSCAASTI